MAASIASPKFDLMPQLEGINFALTSSLNLEDFAPLATISEKMSAIVKEFADSSHQKPLESLDYFIKTIHSTLTKAPDLTSLQEQLSIHHITFKVKAIYPLKLDYSAMDQENQISDQHFMLKSANDACASWDANSQDLLFISLRKITEILNDLRIKHPVAGSSSPTWAYYALNIISKSPSKFSLVERIAHPEYQVMVSTIFKSKDFKKTSLFVSLRETLTPKVKVPKAVAKITSKTPCEIQQKSVIKPTFPT